MLRTDHEDHVRMVRQQDHALASGLMAAEWGNAAGFALPGFWTESDFADVIREETVLAVAQHDNGWWEWEAIPDVSDDDGLPVDLEEIGRDDPEAGLRRWRRGVPRFAEDHPYVALLISIHARNLYAYAFDEAGELPDSLRHPLFGRPERTDQLISDREAFRRFVDEQAEEQKVLAERIRDLDYGLEALQEAQLFANARLVQVLDALSLMLCYQSPREVTFEDVPRGGWTDRVEMQVSFAGESIVRVDPYPFGTPELEVPLLVRRVPKTVQITSLADLQAYPFEVDTYKLIPTGRP